MNLLTKYRSHFPKIPGLYNYQEKVLNSLSSGRNTLAIIPTGGGKSLIYQLFALDQPGITIVVSPLLALMAEQVKDLKDRGICAVALNSAMTFDEQRKFLRNLGETDIKLLYLSPERLQNGIFRASLAASGVKISMVAIDEAHCISQWGQSFRPDYAQIKPFIEFLKNLGQNPITFALTATLAQPPRQAILDEFDIDPANSIIPDSIIRDNLALHFEEVPKEKLKPQRLEHFLEKHQPTKTLVYLYSRPKCERFAEEFAKKDYLTGFYHSDVDTAKKNTVFDRFKKGEIKLLFATTAFGMGINIPDIDAVVHMQIPNSVEEYYQQAGRGWRDKNRPNTCQCLAIWSETNFKRRKQQAENEKYTLESFKKAIKNLLGEPKRKGQVKAKEKDEYLNSPENLPLIRYKLEEKGIITTLGEINGSPQSIQMHTNTDFWEDILKADKHSFTWAAREMKISVREIIDHLYEQEFAGNIKKMPALRRDLFFEILNPKPDEAVLKQMVGELNSAIDQKIRNLEELEELFTSKEPDEMIRALLA